jgi:hypothetical protein
MALLDGKNLAAEAAKRARFRVHHVGTKLNLAEPQIKGKFLCMGFGTTEIIVGREEWGHPRMLSIVRACSTMLASGIRELTGRICRASPTGINYHLDSKRVSKAVTKTSAML